MENCEKDVGRVASIFDTKIKEGGRIGMIYIKTDMKEMPEGCKWYNENGSLERCPFYRCCADEFRIYVNLNPFEPERAEGCPLIRKEDIK